jgi:hypothetical protein
MQANLVTLIRSLMVFVVIGLYGVSTITIGVALVLTIVVLYTLRFDGIFSQGVSHDYCSASMYALCFYPTLEHATCPTSRYRSRCRDRWTTVRLL